MKKIFLLVLMLAACVFSTTYYIDYASGSDANNGTSKSTPWKHAPGMRGRTGNVATYESGKDPAWTLPAGDCFIFKGGVTWPNDCFVWDWIFGKGTGWSIGVDAVYFGVDTTWYSGTSWDRPVFDAEGQKVTPSTDVSNLIVRFYGASGGYFIIDNLEFKGLYALDNDGGNMLALSAGIGEIKNCYFHGWGRGPVVNVGPCNSYYDGIMHSYCNKWASGDDSGSLCGDNYVVISTPYDNQNTDVRIHHCYIDGSDAYPTPGDMAAATKGYMRHFYNNYVYGVQNIITANLCDYVWGNTFLNLCWVPDFDASMHHNMYQSYGSIKKNSYVYNNYAKNSAGGASFFFYPADSTKFYAFNNISCNDSNQIFQLSSSSMSTSSNLSGFYIWNNSLHCLSGIYSSFNGSSSGYAVSAFAIKNNLSIAASKTINAGVNASILDSAKNVYFTVPEANSSGYTPNTTYALYPPSSSAATVGNGVDLSSIISQLVASGPSQPDSACLYDAALGVAIDTVRHTVSYPYRTPKLRGSTWDIGAYEYSGESGGVPERLKIKNVKLTVVK